MLRVPARDEPIGCEPFGRELRVERLGRAGCAVEAMAPFNPQLDTRNP
ncbi:MAG: hypothetical protein OET63_05720 [Desulfobacterales bacterium]|nr:hypothetical protein [Desulfobacterales bacterium]